MKKLSLIILLITYLSDYAQLDSLSNLKYSSELNDVWGYEDELGNEYALVGLKDGFSVVDISDPRIPNEVFRAFGPETAWRDIKTFGDFAYVTNEGDSGLRIYDLSGLPFSTTIPYKNYSGPIGNEFSKAHNLYIDENGFAYIAGTDRSEETIILDLNSDPWNPIEVGAYKLNYLHDVYVKNDTLYGSAISNGELQIIDVSDKSNPLLISATETGKRFTHNAWVSFNGPFIYTTDEVDGGAIEVYDVSDPVNPELVESYKSKTFGDEMPHNVHVEDSIIVISYYKEGVIVLDGSRPKNLVELTRFDTDKALSGPLSGGCWGVYPHFESGRIIATDITKGLFVFDYKSLDAAYIEGIVVDDETGFPLNGVEVKLLNTDKSDFTSFNGEFKEGRVGGGEVKIRFALNGYLSDTIVLALERNKVLNTEVRLKKLPVVPVDISVSLDGVKAEEGVYVSLKSESYFFEGFTNSEGKVLISECPIGLYEFHVGKWGFMNDCLIDSINALNGSFEFNLSQGYFDDFSADQGWEATALEYDVMWQRGAPEPSFSVEGYMYDPDTDDAVGACDGYAYITGIDSNLAALSTTINFTNYLVSPEVVFPPGVENVEVNFSYYLGLSRYANDTLKVGLVNGVDTVYFQELNKYDPTFTWERISFNSSDKDWGDKPFRIIVKITDDLSPWDIVDASIDNVSLNFGPISIKEDINCFEFRSNLLEFTCGSTDYVVYNLKGQIMKAGSADLIDFSSFKNGLYFVQLTGSEVIKFLKSEN